MKTGRTRSMASVRLVSDTRPTPLDQEADTGPPLRQRLLVVVPLAAFVAATTHWMSWQVPIRGRFAADVDDYERIARAAPHFTWPQIEGHVGMWPIHYVIGLTSKASHVPLHALYYVFALATLAAIVVVVDRLLLDVGVDLAVYALAMGTLLLNPYVFRYLALAPAMINDTVFVGAISLALLALYRGRLGMLVAALTAATLARNLSVPPTLVVFGLWVAFAHPHLYAYRSRRLLAGTAVIVVPLAVGGIAYWLGGRAPGHAEPLKNCCSLSEMTILNDIRGFPGSLDAFALHIGRIGIGLAMPLALLIGAGLVLLASGHERPSFPWQLLAATAVGVALVAQPLLVSSAWNDGAEPRLASLAVGPACVAAALVLTRLERTGATLGRGAVTALLAVFAVASLSHRFSWFGPQSASQFAALELVSAAAVIGVLARRLLHRPVDRPTTPPAA